MPERGSGREFSEQKEAEVVEPKKVKFEFVFSENAEGDKGEIGFRPSGKFQYFSGESRPIASQYTIHAPEKFKDKDNMKIVLEEMSRYLMSEFAQPAEPKTEREMALVLFGGYNQKGIKYDGFFPRLRYSLHKERGIDISEADWETALKEVDGLTLNVKDLFPSDDLPLDQENYPNFWQYDVFRTPAPKPPSCKELLPLPFQINVDDGLVKTARKYRTEFDQLITDKEEQKPKEEPELKSKYHCVYGVDDSANAIESMAYYPEISKAVSNFIIITPRGVSYEHTATLAPAVPTKGWSVVFAADTPPEMAAMFMTAYDQWDGLRVLDQYTSTSAGSVESAFRKVEEKYSPENYKRFKEWVKKKRVKFNVQAEPEPQMGYSEKKYRN